MKKLCVSYSKVENNGNNNRTDYRENTMTMAFDQLTPRGRNSKRTGEKVIDDNGQLIQYSMLEKVKDTVKHRPAQVLLEETDEHNNVVSTRNLLTLN